MSKSQSDSAELARMYRAAARLIKGKGKPGDREALAAYYAKHPRPQFAKALGLSTSVDGRSSSVTPREIIESVTADAVTDEDAAKVKAGVSPESDSPPPITVYADDVPDADGKLPPLGEDPKAKAAREAAKIAAMAERRKRCEALAEQTVAGCKRVSKVSIAIAQNPLYGIPDVVWDEFVLPTLPDAYDWLLPKKTPQVHPALYFLPVIAQGVMFGLALRVAKANAIADEEAKKRATKPADPGIAQPPPPDDAPAPEPTPEPESPPVPNGARHDDSKTLAPIGMRSEPSMDGPS